MRIYANCYELMSETGRNIWEMGLEVKPKKYQNKVIEGNDDFITKELTCEQYCLTKMPDPEFLFIHTQSRDWADEEFRERVSGELINPGQAWKLRKDVWEEFLNKHGFFDYTYAERMSYRVVYNEEVMTQLQSVIKLLQEDPDTRKAILAIYDMGSDSSCLDGSSRIPCSMYFDFLIREDASHQKQLNICYHQRSSDFVTHFGNDVYLAWKLKDYVAEKLGIKSGYLYHTIDSLHAYKKDWIKLKTSINDMNQQ